VSLAHLGPAVVELRLSARATLIPTVRTVAADLAGRADLDLDAIEDLRMAVDEACTTLVRLTTEDDSLSCVFTLGEDGIEFSVRTRAAWNGAKVSTDSFGWRVLQTLADDVRVIDGDAGDHDSIGIALHKRSGVVQ
jgi:serine/threonine-protein kinase RsbW